MSKFKVGLLIVFSVFIVIGIVVFALSKGVASNQTADLTVWGFLPQSYFDTYLQSTALGKDKTLSITYVEKTQDNFENDFINALANGAGPDIVMISDDMLLQNENKLFVIPYANYSERTFKDAFVQEGELFLGSDGVYAVPFVIDPLVMYWNRDIFSTAGISLPPQYFDQFLTLPTQLSKTDRSGNIVQSAVALGGWTNVTNAKAILSDIMFSAGTPIVDSTGPTPRNALLDTSGEAISPAESSLDFFTQFANPTSQTYSWNRSEPDSLDDFLSGNLAVYFGFASELGSIRAKNPNLNFDVAFMPQPRQSTKKVVFGKIYGLSIVKQSKNIGSDFQAISELTTTDSISKLGQYTNLPPVSRSLLATAPTNPYQVVFYQSALVSSGWLDPDSKATDQVFQDMVESITSGQAQTSEAINKANDQINALLQ